MQKQNPEYVDDFRRLQEKWSKLFGKLSKSNPKDYDEYDVLQLDSIKLFDRMNQHLFQLSRENEFYQQKVSHLEKDVSSQQEEIQRLKSSLQSLNNEKERLNEKYAEALSRIAQSNRVPTTVYTAGKVFQPVTVARDYSDFVEQAIPSCIRILLKYIQGTLPSLYDKVRTSDVKNQLLSALTYGTLSSDAGSSKDVNALTQSIYGVFGSSVVSFTETFNKELKDLIQGGQDLIEAVSQSGGQLVFYENVPFDEKYHELISGFGSINNRLIQYTATPAYVVRLAHMDEASSEDVLVKAKVVVYDA